MGILNLTPDSFSDNGKYFNPQKALQRALEIQDQGADILDIGGQSTRPGAKLISHEEEWDRIKDILKALNGKLDIPISVDTFYPEVAKKAVENGAEIINDVYCNSSNEMIKIAKQHSCALVFTHNTSEHNIKKFFEKKLQQALNQGLSREQICLDPGIGFNKENDFSASIINHLDRLIIPDVAMLVGISRKRVVGSACGNPPAHKRVAGTIAADTIACLKGANIIRVHDVVEAVQAAKVTDMLLKSKNIF